MTYMTIQPLSDLTTEILILCSCSVKDEKVIRNITKSEPKSGTRFKDDNFSYVIWNESDIKKEFSTEEITNGTAYRRNLI